MSRLGSLSPAALQAMFSPDASDTLAVLLTISGPGMTTVRLTDNYTQRITSLTTDDEVVYGIRSRSQDYIFIPFSITLPTEETEAAPRCQITINDVTRYLIPTIRNATTALSVNIELVLTATPDVVEASFGGFLMSGISYNANTITADLNVESLAIEPFPAHTFTPSYFPGLF
jgi:hypothetical protein